MFGHSQRAVSIWCRFTAQCGSAEAGDRLTCKGCAELRESEALRDALVAFHLWGDIEAAKRVASDMIARGTLVSGGQSCWNAGMTYIHGAVLPIHPSHGPEAVEAWHAKWRDRTVDQYRNRSL